MDDAGDLVAKDLSPQVEWSRPPSPADDTWLTEVARLSAQTWVLRVGSGIPSTVDEGPILRRDLDGWWTGRYVGEIRHRGRTLRIKPRLGAGVITGWVGAAHNVRVFQDAAGRAPSKEPLFVQLAAAMWRAAILDAGRHALPRTRVSNTSVSRTLRGRLDVTGTARLRAAGDPRIASTERLRVLDNAAAAAVVVADRVLGRHLTGPWRGPLVDEHLTRLRSAVGSRPALPTREDLRRMRYTPLTARWRRAADLSHRIATLALLRTGADDETTSGVLVDVAELWELFVLRCAERATNDVVTHGTRTNVNRKLLTSIGKPHRGLGSLYPDVIIGSIGAGPRIIDAKYKRLTDPRGVDRGDLYQVAAYATAFGASTALLAYPGGQDPTSFAEHHSPWRGPAGTVHEFRRLPVTEPDCVAWLCDWLGSDEETVPSEAHASRVTSFM